MKRLALTPVYGYKNAHKLKIILDNSILKIGLEGIDNEELNTFIMKFEKKNLTKRTLGALIQNLLATGLIINKENYFHLTNSGREYYECLINIESKLLKTFLKSITEKLEGMSVLIDLLFEKDSISFKKLIFNWRMVHKNPNWRNETTWNHQLDSRLQWLQSMGIIRRVNQNIIVLRKIIID